ncbi:MAG: AraC family transcriptional regulator [Clostridia bacterium]|nr:AraC family transcriptional regulator [Clostridia bacterium]
MIGYFEDYTKRKHKLICKKLTNTGCQTHFHGEIELSYILSGHHTITVANETQKLTSGDMYYCNPYELHECHSNDNGEHILFTIRPFEYAPISNLLKSSLPNFLNDKAFNKKVFLLLEEIIIKQGTINLLERQGYIGLILGNILSRYGYQSKKTDTKRKFEEILLYIDKHYREPLDRDSLANIFGYSPTYFSRLFEENFHCGLCQYINNLRYERTLSDLASSSSRKTDIILNNGFNNVQSFYRINRERKTVYNNLKEFHMFDGPISND